MVRLKKEINKAETIRQMKNYANNIFKDTWEPESHKSSFMLGVKQTIEKLQEKNPQGSEVLGR